MCNKVLVNAFLTCEIDCIGKPPFLHVRNREPRVIQTYYGAATLFLCRTNARMHKFKA